MRLRSLFLVASAATLWGCSSSDPVDAGFPDAIVTGPAPDAAADGGVTPRPDADPLADAEVVEEDAGLEPDAGFDLTRPASCPNDAAYIVLFNGRVVDQAGVGLGSTKAQMCIHTAVTNDFLCIEPADTSSTGAFTVAVPQVARCMTESTMRFLTPRARRGATYCKIPLARATPETTATVAYSMYDTRPPRTLPPEGDGMTQRTVVFEDGLEVDLRPFDFFADYAPLSSARVPLDHPGLCFLEGQAPFEALYTFAPEGDIEGRAAVRIPNSTGLAANRRVRGYVLGSLGCTLDGPTTLVPEAEWAEFGTGQVSADGQTITIAPGLPCLSWFAYRAE